MFLKEKETVEKILYKVGVEINGSEAWDIQVHNERLYIRVLAQGSLGLGEAYMEKWWDCERVDLFIEKLLRSGKYANEINLPLILLGIKARLLNLQSRTGARKVIEKHYDLSNELYMSFLDPYNQYTCGFFQETSDLDEAQVKKLELICKKLQLKETDRVLDIGCGWGGVAKYAAQKDRCPVVGITISDQQFMYATNYVAG